MLGFIRQDKKKSGKFQIEKQKSKFTTAASECGQAMAKWKCDKDAQPLYDLYSNTHVDNTYE